LTTFFLLYLALFPLFGERKQGQSLTEISVYVFQEH
jgi:hypothetical protein